jgi:antitoxin VapB
MAKRRGGPAGKRQRGARRSLPKQAAGHRPEHRPEYLPPETKAGALEEAGAPMRGAVGLAGSGPAAPAPGERRVRLFKNGRSQAVRIPREFELPGKEAIMRKEGERLIIEPAKPRTLLEVLATLEPMDEEFPTIDDQLPEPVDL